MILRNLIRFSLLLTLLGGSVQLSSAQAYDEKLDGGGYGAYIDLQNYFHVFEEGRFKRLETLPIRDFKVARDFVVYVNNVGQFKMYRDGINRVIRENAPARYEITDNMMVYLLGGQMFAYEAGRTRLVASFVGDYVMGDSMIAFIDVNSNLRVYYKKMLRALEVFDVQEIKVGKNICAYLNNFDELHIYYRGQQEQLTRLLPDTFKCGRNTVAFIDNYRRFKIYHKGNLIQADPFTPRSFQVGDDIVAYVNQNGQFMVFYDGLIQEIESQPPEMFEVKDGIVAYTLPSQQFKAYYDGEVFSLESYVPESYKIDAQTLVYPDFMNKLKSLYHGELLAPAERIAVDYEVNLDVVTALVQMARPTFYWKGKTY